MIRYESGVVSRHWSGKFHRVIENSDQGNPYIVVIDVGTNDLRRTGNLSYVMGDVQDLVNK